LPDTFGTVAAEPAAALAGPPEPPAVAVVDEVVVGFCPGRAPMVGPEPASILLMVFWISAIWSVHGPAHEGLSPNASRALEASKRWCFLVIASS
jgi:hypothetical protein